MFQEPETACSISLVAWIRIPILSLMSIFACSSSASASLLVAARFYPLMFCPWAKKNFLSFKRSMFLLKSATNLSTCWIES